MKNWWMLGHAFDEDKKSDTYASRVAFLLAIIELIAIALLLAFIYDSWWIFVGAFVVGLVLVVTLPRVCGVLLILSWAYFGFVGGYSILGGGESIGAGITGFLVVGLIAFFFHHGMVVGRGANEKSCEEKN